MLLFSCYFKILLRSWTAHYFIFCGDSELTIILTIVFIDSVSKLVSNAHDVANTYMHLVCGKVKLLRLSL